MVEIYQEPDKYIIKEAYRDVVFSIECTTIEEGLLKLEDAKRMRDTIIEMEKEKQKLYLPTPHPSTVAQWIREYRNRLLAESDWTQLSDVPLDERKKEKWLRYREQLRNIPKLWGIDEAKSKIDLSWIRSREDIKKLPWPSFDTVE